jgi:hypothetical protein
MKAEWRKGNSKIEKGEDGRGVNIIKKEWGE